MSKSDSPQKYDFIIPEEWKDPTTKKDRVNISEGDILTHLYEKKSRTQATKNATVTAVDIIPRNKDKEKEKLLFTYYFVESIQENCNHPEVEEMSTQKKSIELSLPQLYLFPESYKIPELKSFDEIQDAITTGHIVIEPYNNEDPAKKYILMKIPVFEKEFCYVEKIKKSLTLDEINKLMYINTTPKTGGGKEGNKPENSDVVYYNDSYSEIFYKDIHGKLQETSVKDYVSYELLQKLGIERFNNYITSPNKTESNTNVPNKLPEYTELFKEHFGNNEDGYIYKSTSAEYFRNLAYKIKKKLIDTSNDSRLVNSNNNKFIGSFLHNLNKLTISQVDTESSSNKKVSRNICVWFLIEKWIDLYITHEFNYELANAKQYEGRSIVKLGEKSQEEFKSIIDETRYNIIKATTQYKIDIVKQQLNMFLPSPSDAIINETLLFISTTIENTYNESSYYKLVDKELYSFLYEMNNPYKLTKDEIKTKNESIREKQSKIQQLKNTKNSEDKIKKLLSDISTLQSEIPKLEIKLKKMANYNKTYTTDDIKNKLLNKFKNHLTEWFGLVGISNNLVDTIVSFIADSVNPERTKSGKEIFDELQTEFDNITKNTQEKPSNNIIIERIIQEVLYLLKTYFKKYIELSAVESSTPNIVPSEKTKPSENVPDSFEITGQPEDDENMIYDNGNKDVFNRKENTK